MALLRRERFDLVHTHNPKPGVLGRVAARLAGTPLVVNTVHGLYATPEDRLRKRAAVLGLEWLAGALLATWSCTRARRTWPGPGASGWPARAAATCSATAPTPASSTRPRSPPERAAALRRELGLPADALVVGAVGRLVAEKGYRELFAAARAVRQADPRVRFLAVGTPDLDKADAISEAELAAAAGDVAGRRLARRRPRPAGRDGRVRARLLARGDAPVGHRGRGHGHGRWS